MDDPRMSEMIEKAQKQAFEYEECFRTKAGKAVLEDLKNQFNYHGTTWNKDKDDMVFYEGCRNVVLYILNTIKRGEVENGG